MSTEWQTAGSLLAWAPSRRSTSTTTRPSPLSPTKLHLSSSRKSLPESAFSQLGVNPLWSLRRHQPPPQNTPQLKCLPPLSSHLSIQARQIRADNWIDYHPEPLSCPVFPGITADKNSRSTMTSSSPTTKWAGYRTPCLSTTSCG